MSQTKLLCFLASLMLSGAMAQPNSGVYVDKGGVLRWKGSKAEANFFGVNYTAPFAYSYRAHRALGADLERAIQQDVYHMSRLGLDAFRVHVWDSEISDVKGNLLENDHLRLFDFLLAELKKRNIKTIITPIAFWGNGYPEPDEKTQGFSQFYGRSKLTTNDSAIVAQENYLKQFFAHVNPYTHLAYKDDPDIIAVEINNEPSHSGPKVGVTRYINRLASTIKGAGWSKPLFYNISQGPYYADAVAASKVDGFSFQWYPSGLVSGSELKGNYLPHVDQYKIPFDTIQSFGKRALMVYEFDAADVMNSVMYPAMARSFRTAGFQWATQFAYDPMALAYANTEYQTHYVNMAYTPSKAVGLLIAARVFHQVPRHKNYGSFPADTVFDSFHVSYKGALSEMNTDKEFYYSNSTSTRPLDVAKIEHIAGVGNSPPVRYEGSGAYFLDKLEDGIWRLEVMPDAIPIRDPFERPSPKKEVTRIQWRANAMTLDLPNLGSQLVIKGLNANNHFVLETKSAFRISPGTYLVTRAGKELTALKRIDLARLGEFVAPQPTNHEVYLRHQPLAEVLPGKAFLVRAKVVGIDTGNVTLLINRFWGQFKRIAMTRESPNDYVAVVPADIVQPGLLNYRIEVQQVDDFAVFPGNIKGNPAAWDYYLQDSWQTFVLGENKVELFNATSDKAVKVYPPWRRNVQTSFVTTEPGQLCIRVAASELSDDHLLGFQFAFGEKLHPDVDSYTHLIVRVKTTNDQPLFAKVALIDAYGLSISTSITLKGTWEDIVIPISSMTPAAALLMPRPYPGFQPMWFKGPPGSFRLSKTERIEVTAGTDVAPSEYQRPCALEVEYIRLVKDIPSVKQ